MIMKAGTSVLNSMEALRRRVFQVVEQKDTSIIGSKVIKNLRRLSRNLEREIPVATEEDPDLTVGDLVTDFVDAYMEGVEMFINYEMEVRNSSRLLRNLLKVLNNFTAKFTLDNFASGLDAAIECLATFFDSVMMGRNEKTAEELFQDFLYRLKRAGKYI